MKLCAFFGEKYRLDHHLTIGSQETAANHFCKIDDYRNEFHKDKIGFSRLPCKGNESECPNRYLLKLHQILKPIYNKKL